MGYGVKARGEIKENTIICEYAGCVNIKRDYIGSNENDQMQLFTGYNSSDTLIIRPG